MYVYKKIPQIEIVKKAIPLICQRCEHRWNYTGLNKYVAPCPTCNTKVTIAKSYEKVIEQ